ncbi:MAG: hypothetical protein M0042_00700 [Nitrospiraceae bacterium]|nr:hypothetical protein [Nitrospiraceae bacterium]
MKKIVFLTPEDVSCGFRLAGIEHRTSDPADMTAELEEILHLPDVGLVIIDERLVGTENEDLVLGYERDWQGILLMLPSPVKPPPEVEDYAARLIRRAIGYHVRLNV